MSLLYPELLLLAIPIALALYRTSRGQASRWLLRGLAVLAFLLALAGPHGGGSTTGRDLVLLVDRSRSMPGDRLAETAEMVELLNSEMRAGDRLAVLGFGAGRALEMAPSEDPSFAGFQHGIDPDGSHLAEAIDQALALIPDNRPGSLLLLSDGEYHGASPESAARRAGVRSVRIDVRSAQRPNQVDAAVEQLELPPSVAQGEPFQFAAWVRSDHAVEAEYVLYRDQEVLTRGRRALRRGLNQLLFRDLGTTPGLARYRLRISVEGDRVLENDIGLGVLRVTGGRPLLLVNHDAVPGRLARVLQSAGLELALHTPEELARQRPSYLENFRGVILENVAADRLGPMLPALARQVEDLGGGLLLTGGPASFGVGGYYRSGLDPLLPVSMEMRVEHRKMGLSLAFVLDRSGSMAAGVGGTLTKMDLANAGTMEGIRLLGALDEVAVIAVDSEAHVVVPLAEVGDPEDFAGRVSGIRSQGGGIYVYQGLLAAASMLEGASRNNRHIVLFADADDAEEPGKYVELLRQLREERNTTVSVVALGTPTGSDAAFLIDVARRGGGEIFFSQDPNELPRLFAQDTLLAARSSFIDVPTPTQTTPGVFAIAALPSGPWAPLAGYNLSYLRPDAAQGVVTQDEYGAPVLATRQAGLGRTASFSGQIDGKFGVADDHWPQVAETLVTLARWIAGQEPPAEYFPDVRREGRDALVSIEVDREAAPGAPSPVEARMVKPDGTTTVVELTPVGPDRFEARVPLGMEGIYRFAAQTADGQTLEMEPLAVPYSPEFEPRAEEDDGLRALGRIARLSGGRMNPAMNEVLRGSRRGYSVRPLGHWFALAGLLLLLAEITWRRLFEKPPRVRTTAVAGARSAGGVRRPDASGGGSADAGREPDSGEAQVGADSGETTDTGGLNAALAGAKKKADRRTRRK